MNSPREGSALHFGTVGKRQHLGAVLSRPMYCCVFHQAGARPQNACRLRHSGRPSYIFTSMQQASV